MPNFKPKPIAALFVLVVAAACAPAARNDTAAGFPVLTGPYLGQPPPGPRAQLFAPGIVSTGMYTRDIAMTPDGKEIYFGAVVSGFSVILQTKLENGRWTKPEVAPFSRNPDYMNLEPCISPDGRKFLFLSTRPPDGGAVKPEDRGRWVHQNIWVMDRKEAGWGEPYNIGPPVYSEDSEFFPSLTRDGTLYFTRSKEGGKDSSIYRSRLVNGTYAEPERLGPQVNSGEAHFNAFIAPDESYIIVCVYGRKDTLGSTDYYIVFRREDDTWSEPMNMGGEVNTPDGGEFSPYVSPDGKYFFFMSTRPVPRESVPESLTYDYLEKVNREPLNGNASIYWVDAAFIDELKRNVVKR